MNIDLTHPEILTIEQLQKFVGSNTIFDRVELIELFYKYVAPLPQRKFRDNRLGLILTANQKQSEEISCNKHESNRGIYTIKLNSKHTAPIKLKRRSSTNTTSTDPDVLSKRLKSDASNS